MKATNETRLRTYWKLSFGLATLVLLCLRTAIAQTTYTVTDLGTLCRTTDLGTLCGTFGVAQGVNNKGWVDGIGNLPGDTTQHAFLWLDGLKIDLGTLGGPNSQAFLEPNESGQVVGQAETSTPDPNNRDFCLSGSGLPGTGSICRAFLWQNGVMGPLSPPTLGGNNSIASAINNRGQIVGFAENARPDPTCTTQQTQFQFKPVIWEKGEIQELPPFQGDPDGAAFVINDLGQAVGSSGTCTAALHAVLWQNGTATDLGNLGGTMNNVALNINNQGQVVGESDLPGDTTFHAFLWQNGVITDLDPLLDPLDFHSGALGINSKGQVVGGSCNMDFSVCRALLWQNGVMTDLNTLIIPAGSPLSLFFAFDINDRGEIVGCGALQTSTGSIEIHAFLATPSNGEAASGSATTAALGQTSGSPKVVLPDNVRKLLQQRLGFGRWVR